MHKERAGIVASVTLLLVAIAGVIATPAYASPPNTSRAIVGLKTIDGVETDAPVADASQLRDFLASDEPKTVHIENGRLVSVYTGIPDDVAVIGAKPLGVTPASIGVRSPCGSYDFCLRRISPYSSIGYYGTGVINPSVNYVSSFYTGQYGAIVGTYSPTLGCIAIDYWYGGYTYAYYEPYALVCHIELGLFV